MEDDHDQEPPAPSLLPYEEWTETALRQVVMLALDHVAQHGLPGGHHFYLTFRTDHPGVVLPPRLRAQYPQEMTIVLQHQFWELTVDQEASLIRVGLSFGGVPASLVIPLDAVLGFADPYARYGLRFHVAMPEAPAETAGQPVPAPATPPQDKDTAERRPEEAGQVVNLAAFRRQTAPRDG